jgi:hypothetical protein
MQKAHGEDPKGLLSRGGLVLGCLLARATHCAIPIHRDAGAQRVHRRSQTLTRLGEREGTRTCIQAI